MHTPGRRLRSRASCLSASSFRILFNSELRNYRGEGGGFDEYRRYLYVQSSPLVSTGAHYYRRQRRVHIKAENKLPFIRKGSIRANLRVSPRFPLCRTSDRRLGGLIKASSTIISLLTRQNSSRTRVSIPSANIYRRCAERRGGNDTETPRSRASRREENNGRDRAGGSDSIVVVPVREKRIEQELARCRLANAHETSDDGGSSLLLSSLRLVCVRRCQTTSPYAFAFPRR